MNYEHPCWFDTSRKDRERQVKLASLLAINRTQFPPIDFIPVQSMASFLMHQSYNNAIKKLMPLQVNL